MTTKSIFKGILAFGMVVLLGACSEDAPYGGGNGEGRISPLVGLNTTVRAPRQNDGSPSSRAEELTANDLSLKLIAEDGSVKGEWASIADFDSGKQFAIGNYTLEAWHGTAGAQGFECPYYYGSAPVVVKDGRTTQVALTASLAQTMVTVKYTEAFRTYMTQWEASVNGQTYQQDETRAIYVSPGTVNVNVSFTKPNGTKGENIRVASFEALPRTHYTLTVNVNDGHVGQTEMVVTYDDEMEQQEEVIDISDSVLNAPAPIFSTEGFTSGEGVTIIESMGFEGVLKVNFIAMANLAHINMETNSPGLIAQGWPQSIDLLACTPEQQATLTGLGMETLGMWRNVGQMAVADLSKVLLHMTSGADAVNIITMTAVDSYGKTTEPVVLSVNIEPLVLEIESNGQISAGQAPSFLLNYNGNEVETRVGFKYQNERGTWSDITDYSIAVASRATKTYVVTVNSLPSSVATLKVKAVFGDKETEVLNIGSFPFEFFANANDVFARHALLGVSGTEVNPTGLATGMSFMASSDGKIYTPCEFETGNEGFVVKNLEPGTEMSIYAVAFGVRSNPITVTTEAAAQIPYGDMETWGEADVHKYWSRVFLGTENDNPWGTLNWLTTSFSGTRDNTAYCNFSGTRSTGDTHTGAAAAIIETVGWGANAAQLFWTDTKNLTPGQLYLGVSNGTETPAYGITFGSRPQKLSFWYKYTAKNSADYGKAFAKLFDTEGNLLAEKEVSLTATNAYTQIEFDFATQYPAHCAKAGSLQLTFFSSGHPDVKNQNSSEWLSRPPFANLTDGRFTGSSLYIDDVELIY